MLIGLIIIFFASLYYYVKTKKIEGIVLTLATFILIAINVFSSYVFPFWLVKNPDYKDNVATVYVIILGISSLFSILMGVGFILLINRTVKLISVPNDRQQ